MRACVLSLSLAITHKTKTYAFHRKNRKKWWRGITSLKQNMGNTHTRSFSLSATFLHTHTHTQIETACNLGVLFFQNATQMQLHGGKNPIVLYQEMQLQFELHVSIEPDAASLLRFNWSGPPPRTRNFSQNTWYMYQVFLQKVSCSWSAPDQWLQLHFMVQYNGGFTTVKLHLDRVLEK